MKNIIKIAVFFCVVGTLRAGSAQAQQTPAASSKQTPANTQQASTPKTGTNSPAQPGQPAPAKGPDGFELKTDKEKASYAIGMNIGQNLRRQSDMIDAAIVERGMKDALAGDKTLMTEAEAKASLMALQNTMRKKQEEQVQQIAETNKKEGDTFLAENRTKAGVVTLPSGLQYKILSEGTGPKPTATDSVVCNYKGTLLDGTEFDSSAKHGGPATFPVNGVIKGWTEALQLMPVGSKWQLFVPSDLAYGQRGAGGGIAPNSTLIFEVELVSIKSSAAQPGTPAPGIPSGAEGPKGDPVLPVQDPNKAQDPSKSK
jgi:FKBP-type peptidyl-prolyl cis-trans isomerase FklB